MNVELYNKCKTYNFESLFKRKGYAFFTKGEYNLNIIGVRHKELGNKATNLFDDVILLDYNTNIGHKRPIFACTTKPGLAALENPINSDGTAILVPGQYRGVYGVGLHKGKYKALCQINGTVKVYRDNNRNNIYDMYPETIQKGYFGINIHRADKYNTSKYVNTWSAACQVIADPANFHEFMRLVQVSEKLYGNKFTYTLIDEDDMI